MKGGHVNFRSPRCSTTWVCGLHEHYFFIYFSCVVYKHIHVGMCICTCMIVQVWAHICEGQGSIFWVFLNCSLPQFLRQDRSLVWDSLIQLDWLVSKPSSPAAGSSCLWLSSAGFIGSHCPASILCECQRFELMFLHRVLPWLSHHPGP